MSWKGYWRGTELLGDLKDLSFPLTSNQGRKVVVLLIALGKFGL